MRKNRLRGWIRQGLPVRPAGGQDTTLEESGGMKSILGRTPQRRSMKRS